jgi:lysozyme
MDLITKWEGCELDSYKCPAGIWTIGFGNTFYENGEKVKQSDKITKIRAYELLDWYLKNQIKLPAVNMTSKQRMALNSLIYNIGQANFDKSKLKQAIIDGDSKVIFNNWNFINAGGKFLRGLALRRIEELQYWFS